MSVGRAGQRLGRPLAEASHGTRGVTTRGLADRGHRYLYSPRPYRNGPPCHWRVGQPRRQRWYHQSSGCFTSRFLSASVGFPIIIIPVRPPPAVFVAEFLRSSLSLSPASPLAAPLLRPSGADWRFPNFFRSSVSGYYQYHLYLLVQKRRLVFCAVGSPWSLRCGVRVPRSGQRIQPSHLPARFD
jgi:hypothetical protein